MSDIEMSPEEISEIFGGEVTEAIQIDEDEAQVNLALANIRDHLLTALQRDSVGINQLARRLNVAPSSVSRLLGGEGDMRVSTMILYARALGRVWNFSLAPNNAQSNFYDMINFRAITAAYPTTSGIPKIVQMEFAGSYPVSIKSTEISVGVPA